MQTVIKFKLEAFRTRKRVERLTDEELTRQFKLKALEYSGCQDTDRRSELVKELEELRSKRERFRIRFDNVWDNHRTIDRHYNGMSKY